MTMITNRTAVALNNAIRSLDGIKDFSIPLVVRRAMMRNLEALRIPVSAYNAQLQQIVVETRAEIDTKGWEPSMLASMAEIRMKVEADENVDVDLHVVKTADFGEANLKKLPLAVQSDLGTILDYGD